jgi:hypothetical protein
LGAGLKIIDVTDLRVLDHLPTSVGVSPPPIPKWAGVTAQKHADTAFFCVSRLQLAAEDFQQVR